MITPIFNECPNCFETFETKYETKIYCSRYCKETAKRRRQGVRKLGVDYPPTYSKICAGCGDKYVTTRASKNYCDRSCYQYHKDQRKRNSAAYLESNARQKFRNKVYLRDEGICQLCNEYVYLNVKYPDPMSPSLDHKIPISKGGTNALYNLQLTHLSCNIKRGNANL